MEALLAALLGSGPAGVVAVGAVLALGVVWLELRATRTELRDERAARLAEAKEAVKALYAATEAIEQSNDGRQAVMDSLRELANGVAACKTLLSNDGRQALADTLREISAGVNACKTLLELSQPNRRRS